MTARATRPAARPATRRGRPPRLSRDAILEAALAALERKPDEPLTLTRIAAEVEAVPAALYRHFSSLDDLLDAVLGRVLGAVELDIRKRAAWPDQIRDWMSSLRNHLVRYPGVLPLIGRRGRTSPAWLDATAVQIEILRRAGLKGAKLARTHLWITEITIALVVQEATVSVPDQIAFARASLKEMSGEGRTLLAPLMTHLAAIEADDLFAFMVDRTIAGLEDLVDGGGTS